MSDDYEALCREIDSRDGSYWGDEYRIGGLIARLKEELDSRNPTLTPVWEVPRGTKIRIDGKEYLTRGMDGMYLRLVDEDDNIIGNIGGYVEVVT